MKERDDVIERAKQSARSAARIREQMRAVLRHASRRLLAVTRGRRSFTGKATGERSVLLSFIVGPLSGVTTLLAQTCDKG